MFVWISCRQEQRKDAPKLLDADGTLLLMAASASVLSACVLSGCGGSAQAQLTDKTVNGSTGSSSTPTPTVNFSSSPAAISPGQAAMLSWSATNATSCTASGSWSGSVSTSGSQSTGALNSTSQYVLTCIGAGGTTRQTTSVSVESGTAPPNITISANPSIIASGDSSTLTWSSTNATSCTASGAWSGTPATSGTFSTGALSANATYTIDCSGPGGSAQESTTITINQAGPSCTGTSGPLTLKAKAVRASGISPLLMFFDATGTTDSSINANTTTFQDVAYSWNFGDANPSGTGTWKYGSNGGHNSKNTASGGVAAHLYVTPGADTAYTVTVTANDGTNTASCQLGVTAYDPAGSNGFAGTKTACVSSSGTPVAGSGGCPAGATVLQQSNAGTALSAQFASNKRVLFKCGDTFSGGYTIGAGSSTWSIGAYGGCENTASGRPVFGGGLSMNSSNTTVGPIDGRISDIDFEGGGSGLVAVTTNAGFNVQQITLYNLYANGLQSGYYLSGGSQTGLIQSVLTGMTSRIGVFLNYAENNCLNGSSALNCGQGSSPVFANIAYTAALGNDFNGQGVNNSASIETFRMSACRFCVIANNTVQNASTGGGATFKFHSGNTYDSRAVWLGQYTEMVEISDNLFGGTSGAQLTEVSPQNGNYDERLRNIVLERNIFAGTSGAKGILLSAVNATLRDNIFYSSSGNSRSSYGAQIAQRANEPLPAYVEFYNNTCYGISSYGACAGFDGTNYAAPGINSWAKNNLFYNSGNNSPTIVDNGSGNTVSNNTANSTVNPGMVNASGAFGAVSDFQPTANYSGGTSVPVWYDALGAPWASTWDLGAVHP